MRIEQLNQFEKIILALADSGITVNQPHDDIYHLTIGNTSLPAIGIVALTHGEEIVGLPIITELALSILENRFQILNDIYLIIANRQAYLDDTRYVDTDLNRLYGELGDKKNTLEGKRIQAIKDTVDKCDVVIDIHQTVESTLHPFFIFPPHDKTFYWAKRIAPQMPIVLHESKEKFATTLSSYMTAKDKIGITFEVADSGADIYQVNLGLQTIIQAIELLKNERIIEKSHPLREQAPTYTLKHIEPYTSGQVNFVKDYSNFDFVNEGDLIVTVDEKPIHAPISGHLFLAPKKWHDKTSKTVAEILFCIMEPGSKYMV